MSVETKFGSKVSKIITAILVSGTLVYLVSLGWTMWRVRHVRVPVVEARP